MTEGERTGRTGGIFAVVGPSGAGKDTLMEAAAARRPDLHLVRRLITRPEEAGGEAFEGVAAAEFARRKAAGDFLLDWEAHGLRYGIPASAARLRAAGCDVLFNASRGMIGPAFAALPDLVVIHVTAAPELRAARLAARGREDAADIARRLARAGDGIAPGPPVRLVRNDGTLEAGVA